MPHAPSSSAIRRGASPWRRQVALTLLSAALCGALLSACQSPPVAPLSADAQATLDATATRLRSDVASLVSRYPQRDPAQTEALDRLADELHARLAQAGGQVEEQIVEWRGKRYRNVSARFGPTEGDPWVIGAHYDAVKGAPGADDNASGVAGLLELARRFGMQAPTHPVILATYCLEESGLIGSHSHAQGLLKQGVAVRGMVSLEMIGYYDERPGSQGFPHPVMGWFYPDTGEHILVVGRPADRMLELRLRRGLADAGMPAQSVLVPRALVPDIGRSDHAPFWRAGFPALMLTDSANFRNHAYHTADDRPERLDYARMARVVDGVERAFRLP